MPPTKATFSGTSATECHGLIWGETGDMVQISISGYTPYVQTNHPTKTCCEQFGVNGKWM